MSSSYSGTWQLVNLNDLGEVNRGRSRHRPRYAEHLYGGAYPFIQTGDVKASDGRITKFTQTYSDAGLAQSRLWPAGTMCITIAANIAETGILQSPACFPDSIVGFVADPTKADVRFIEYSFRYLKSSIQNQANGSVQDNINLETLARLRFPVPSLLEQHAIADVLGALDDKIAANDRVVDLSDKLAEAVLSKSLDGRSSPLASQALVTMGSSPPGTSYNEKEDGLPFYQGVRDFGIRFPRRRVWTTAPVRTARTGDTLVSVRAPVGKTNIANEDMCIGRGVASLRSRSQRPMTLFHQVRAAHEAWAPYEAEGTVFGAINRSQLEAVLLPMVRSEASGKVEHALTAIENRIAAALSENETLVTTRDQLLPLLMSGKVRVLESERILEGVV
ncbi:restriction endonuclease subunit S [Amycolatopsis sp. GM8]|uniref:restriction endonuclease subunit S n=1 Tax=Amycolatopsis sp. GM8 TaxID=2896530 RepID=UPI002104BEE9|nr:restriction endonuclease subunit S [Amycolatopsis sp. GM8]